MRVHSNNQAPPESYHSRIYELCTFITEEHVCLRSIPFHFNCKLNQPRINVDLQTRATMMPQVTKSAKAWMSMTTWVFKPDIDFQESLP